MHPIDRIFEVLQTGAGAEYGNERVSQLDHALQCAALAEQAGAPPAVIAAALLHDIGHLLNPDERAAYHRGEDARHEVRGAAWLEQWFAAEVTEPVRWHVAAKRYLTAVDQNYHDLLSPISKRSLELQGGPFTAAAADAFGRRPFAEQTVAVRRWDDAAKVVGRAVPPLAHFRGYLEASLSPSPDSGR